jgi:hypothetical protein
MAGMGVSQDCRHYLHRSTGSGEAVQRCRLSANTEDPFACPDGCLFFEARTVSAAGWAQPPPEPMTNTADGLLDVPTRKTRRGRKKR